MAHREEVKDMLLTEYNEAASHELFQLEGERIGREITSVRDIRKIMEKMNYSAEEAMDLLDVPRELREKYAKEL